MEKVGENRDSIYFLENYILSLFFEIIYCPYFPYFPYFLLSPFSPVFHCEQAESTLTPFPRAAGRDETLNPPYRRVFQQYRSTQEGLSVAGVMW